MDLSLFLSILGTIATVVFGFLSVDLFKRKKYPGKISFIELKSISLFNNIAKNFDEISILHNSLPIKENIIYIQGAFVNTGDIDIDEMKIEKDISIHLPEKFEWIKCKITRASSDLKCNSIIDNPQVLHFDLGLFRRSEYFEFEALIEAQDGAKNYNEIIEKFKFDHRIANTQDIQKTELISENQITKKKRSLKSNAIFLAIILTLYTTFFSLDIFYLRSAKIYYLTNNKKGEFVEYSVAGKNNNTVELSEVNGDDKKIVPIAEFQQQEKFKPIIPKETIWQKLQRNMWSTLIWALFYVLYVCVDFYEIRKANRMYKALEKINNYA